MSEPQLPNLGALIGRHREPVPITFAEYQQRTRKEPDEPGTP